MNRALLTLTMLAGITLSACAGQRAPASAPPAMPPSAQAVRDHPGLGGLPGPSALSAALSQHQSPKRASYDSDKLVIEGEAFEPALPHQRVTAQAASALFAPDWSSPGAPFSGIAFAMYNFELPGYGGNAALTYEWTTPPSDESLVYIGLANWATDRWDWYQGNAQGLITPASLAPYFILNGDLLACVVELGTSSSELDRLRIGSLPPMRNLVATPTAGLIPLTVNFDATGSIDLDGSIAEYRWDPEGDGSFDVSTGTDPLFSFEYAAAGTTQAALRIVDNDGVYADIGVQIKALDSVNFSFGAEGTREYPKAVLPATNGDVLLFGNWEEMSFPSDRDGYVARLGLGATESYCKSWGGGSNDYIEDAKLGPDGFVYTVGYTYSFGQGGSDALLQKWNQDGALVYSKSIGSSDDDEHFRRLITYGGSIYACGSYDLNVISRSLGFIAKFDMDGGLIWSHTLIGAFHSGFDDLSPRFSILGDPTIEVCGAYYTSDLDSDALYAKYTLDGDRLACKIWGNGTDYEFATSLCVTGAASPLTTVAGQAPGGSFIARPGGSTYMITSSSGLPPKSVCIRPGGGASMSLLLSGSNPGDTSEFMVLSGFSQSLALLSWHALSSQAQKYLVPNALSFHSGSRMVVTGYQDGPIPAPLDYALERQAASTELWEDISPSQGSPSQLVIADTPLDLSDISGSVFDRAGNDDFDAFVYITP